MCGQIVAERRRGADPQCRARGNVELPKVKATISLSACKPDWQISGEREKWEPMWANEMQDHLAALVK
jgi:hypothetical protein